MACRESLDLRSKKARANHFQQRHHDLAAYNNNDLSAQLAIDGVGANDADEIRSLMSEFQFETDPFENRLQGGTATQGNLAGCGNELEMHGPPNDDISRDVFLQQQ